MKSKNHKDIL